MTKRDLSPGRYTRKELPRYWTLRPKALASNLAKEGNPETAKHYAEVLAQTEQLLGVPGRDPYAVRDIIRDYAKKIDLQAHFDNADMYQGPQHVRYTKIKRSR